MRRRTAVLVGAVGLCALGAVGAALWAARPAGHVVVETHEIPDRYVRLLLENPNAQESRARKEEGAVGRRESKIERAKGNRIEVKKLEIDRQVAEKAGVLGAKEDSSLERVLQLNPATMVASDRFSTFAIDVDTGSYTLVRRSLTEGALPPAAAVRVEELVNYLPYRYAPPSDDAPVAIRLEAARHPADPQKTLLRVGLQARALEDEHRKPVHLTFLVDVSGSMQGADRLPLAQQSLRWLVDHLGPEDTVAMATYAGTTKIALPPTPTSRRAAIHEAIEALDAGGSTAMNSGLELAYTLAQQAYLEGCENRVIVLSDGDANVGPAGLEANLRTIRSWAGRGITLSTVGFGTGNYKDTLMEQLADQGDGNYAYVDSFTEAKRVFGERLAGTVHTVARDVKVQVEFSPTAVTAYRLVGYENRDLADADFREDAVDAGEIGSGQQVTALYELHLAEAPVGRLATVHFRAKPPGPDAPASEWATYLTVDSVLPSFDEASRDTRNAFGAATFAELLRGSPYTGELGHADVLRWIDDPDLAALVRRADELAARTAIAARR